MIRKPAGLSALLLLAACVGDISGDRRGVDNPGPGGPGSVPGPGGSAGPGPGPMMPPGGGTIDPTRPPPNSQPPPPPGMRPPAAAISTTRLARLGHRQWENTVRDLLRLPAPSGLSVKFSSDAVGTFSNDGEVLAVSDNLRTDYQTAAETLAVQVARDPAALARLVPAGAPADAKGRAAAFIRDFGRRAYRRPLDDQEIAAHTALFDQGPALVPGVEPFAAGVQVVLEAMLQSPHFLYRTELTTGAGRTRLSDHEIAARLSYALAASMPDDPLFAAASAGALRTIEQVTTHAERLMGGKGGEPSATFHEELLELRALVGDVEKDPRRFPEFKPAWRDSMLRESQMFLGDIFAGNKGLAELLTSPFTFVDGVLAPLYGVKAPAAAGGFGRVDLDPRLRAGFLTQIGFLARTGETESDPILRGAFINQKLLCLDLEPPPGATEMIVQPPPTARTNRERVTAITSAAMCAACHRPFINPAGFAFESFDALGRHRTTDNGQPVDTADTYAFPSGPKSFKDAVEWSRVLADSREAHECYARGWLTYLQGRTLRAEDEPLVKWLAGRSHAERASLRALVLTIVTDDSFLTRLP